MKRAFIITLFNWHALYSHFLKNAIEIAHLQKVKVFIFSNWYRKKDQDKKEMLSKIWVHLLNFSEFDDSLWNGIKKIHESYKVLYIDTPMEWMVLQINEFRERLWHAVTPDYRLFKDKSLQRKLFSKYSESLRVTSIEYHLSSSSFEDITSKLNVPFVLKPLHLQWSEWVSLIQTTQDFKEYKLRNQNQEYCLAEEYLPGSLYSFDYYVGSDGRISYSHFLRTESGRELGINDFCLYTVHNHDDIHTVMDVVKVKKFIEDTVRSCNIKNTFVCHEFQIREDGSFWTIELNGRIGWRVIEPMRDGYDLNMYNLFFHNNPNIVKTPQLFTAIFKFFPKKTWILKSYNYKLIQKIQKLPSCYAIDIYPDIYEWRKIWLTGDGYWHVGFIKIRNKNKDQYLKDYNFIKDNYLDLLIME